jgi:hypothetical protein
LKQVTPPSAAGVDCKPVQVQKRRQRVTGNTGRKKTPSMKKLQLSIEEERFIDEVSIAEHKTSKKEVMKKTKRKNLYLIVKNTPLDPKLYQSYKDNLSRLGLQNKNLGAKRKLE